MSLPIEAAQLACETLLCCITGSSRAREHGAAAGKRNGLPCPTRCLSKLHGNRLAWRSSGPRRRLLCCRSRLCGGRIYCTRRGYRGARGVCHFCCHGGGRAASWASSGGGSCSWCDQVCFKFRLQLSRQVSICVHG